MKKIYFFLFTMGLSILFCITLRAQTITSAGENQLVTGTTASLLGTITGSGTNYSWSVQLKPTGSPNPVFSNSSSLNPVISGLATGTYKLRLRGPWFISNNYKDVYLYVTGSRGTPSVNIDFGTGNTSQTLNSYLTTVGGAGTTGLNYVHNGGACPENGNYSILPQSQGTCFGNGWINANDHTTRNGTGRFLIVNANNVTAGTYYEQTINSTCSGTAYEFSVWVANLNNISRNGTSCGGQNYELPTITFSFYDADANTLITSKSTGPVPMKATVETDPWKRYAATVKMPAGVSRLRVEMTSSIGGCGVDFGLDDIQLTPYGPSISVSITGGTGPGGSIFERPYGSSFSFGATPQPVILDDGSSYTFASPVYQWQRKNRLTGVWENLPAATTQQYAVNNFAKADTGWYRIIMANSGNIDNSDCRIISTEVYLKGPDEISLPVTLGAFTVNKQNSNEALLKWTTLSEKENAYFEIYRSLNGTDFERVGTTVPGNGTSGLTNHYQFTDNITGLKGIIYYRLKDVDFDGRGNFSKIISLRGDDSMNTINVYPNPFSDNIKVTINNNREQTGTIRLMSIAGQVVATRQLMLQRGQNIVVLSALDKLPKGLYVVEFVSEETKVVEKILK